MEESMQVMTTAEVAKILNLVPDRVRQLANARALPAVRIARGQRLFRRADVMRFVAERAANPPRPGGRPVVAKEMDGDGGAIGAPRSD